MFINFNEFSDFISKTGDSCIKGYHIENGIISIHLTLEDDSDLMALRKHNLTLAIGNLSKEYDYLVNYCGYRSIISFLINSNDLIKIVEA